jgi:hypothetical protein
MTHLFTTGSLVTWKRPGANISTGLVLSIEKQGGRGFPKSVGAWVHWSDREDPMWSPIMNLHLHDNEDS